MSDEKIDRIDKRLSELVTITGNLVFAVKDLNEKFEDLNEKVEVLTEKVDNNTEQIKVVNKKVDRTSAILDEALMRIIELQKS